MARTRVHIFVRSNAHRPELYAVLVYLLLDVCSQTQHQRYEDFVERKRRVDIISLKEEREKDNDREDRVYISFTRKSLE